VVTEVVQFQNQLEIAALEKTSQKKMSIINPVKSKALVQAIKEEPWKFSLFALSVIACFFPIITPPIALAIGIILAALKSIPKAVNTGAIASFLLKVSIVLMGFGINLNQAISTSKSGFVLSAVFILTTLVLGIAVTKIFKVERITGILISIGTAICGGSAIAAVSPVVGADKQQLSLSLGVVFLLNAIALLIFPLIGSWIGLGQTQFGYWAAIAIHDTSSVVGAGAAYGEEALRIATTVKLTRALWIIPVSLVFAFVFSKKSAGKVKIPWFIFLFLLAMIIRYYLPSGAEVYNILDVIGKKGMVITLLLVGAGLSIAEIKVIGPRPLFLGVLLWIIISMLSLFAVLHYF